MTDERYPIEQPDKSLGDLVGDLTTEFSNLVQSHIQLAKAEITEDARKAGRAGAMFGVAAVAGLLALIMLSFAAAWALAETMAAGWAFLIVGVVWAVVVVVFASTGKKLLAQMNPGPHETIEEVRKDKQWLKTQTN